MSQVHSFTNNCSFLLLEIVLNFLKYLIFVKANFKI